MVAQNSFLSSTFWYVSHNKVRIKSVVARKKVGEYILPPYFFLASTPLFPGNYFSQKNLGAVSERYDDTVTECKSEFEISVGYPGIFFQHER